MNRLRKIGLILLVLAIVAPMLGMAGTILGMMQTYNEAFNELLDRPPNTKGPAPNLHPGIRGGPKTASSDRPQLDIILTRIWMVAGFITGVICAVMGVVLVLLSGLKFQRNSSTSDASVSTSA